MRLLRARRAGVGQCPHGIDRVVVQPQTSESKVPVSTADSR
jgi:hypothetical protein